MLWNKSCLDGCCWLICSFNNFKPTSVDCWIYHCECKQRVCFGWYPFCKWNGPTRSTQTMTQGSDSANLGGSSPYFLRVFSFIVILHTWQVEHKQSIFNILCKTRPYHGIPDSLFCSSLSWIKLIFMVPGQYSLSQWLRNLDLFFVEKKIIAFNFSWCCFLILREVLTLLPLESSGFQCQDGVKHQ
jgi:hypothetical protein